MARFKPDDIKKLNITSLKIIYFLIAMLLVFSFMKIYSNGSLAKKLIDSKATLVLAELQSTDRMELDKNLTSGFFCGWQLTKGNGDHLSSKDFNADSADGVLFNRDFEKDGLKQRITICMNAHDQIDSNTKRQLIFVTILSGVLAFMIYNENIKNENIKNNNRNESSQKLPTT